MFLLHFIKIHSVLKYAGIFAPVSSMQEALALVRRYHIKAEIIGGWLYCFPSLLIGIQLLSIGFWFSFRHCAYVYTGNEKEFPTTNKTLDELRAWLGSQEVEGV